MPAITCRKCGAVVSAQSSGDGIEVSYGSSFRESCKSLPETGSPDPIAGVAACSHLEEAIERARFRITRRKKRQAGDKLGLNSGPSDTPVASTSGKVDIRP